MRDVQNPITTTLDHFELVIEAFHKPKLSLYKIFNYILDVLHTGIQWAQLKTNRKELHYTNVYKWHNRWSKDGSYQALFVWHAPASHGSA
jgi:transposase